MRDDDGRSDATQLTWARVYPHRPAFMRWSLLSVLLPASAGRPQRQHLWLPPGFRPGTPKRNVLVAVLYLVVLSGCLELLRLLV